MAFFTRFAALVLHAAPYPHRGEDDEEGAERAAEQHSGELRRQKRPRRRQDERGQHQKDETLLLQKAVLCVHGEGERRHREKGEEVDALRRRLREAEKERKEGDERRSAAHAHTAEHAADHPRKEEKKKAHGKSSLSPAASMTPSKSSEIAPTGRMRRSFAPRSPPSSTPSAAGIKSGISTSPEQR